MLSCLSLCSALITTSHPGPALDSALQLLVLGGFLSLRLRSPTHTHRHTCICTDTHGDSGMLWVFVTRTQTRRDPLRHVWIHVYPHKQSQKRAHTYSEFRPGGFGSACRLGLWRDL